MNIRIFALVLLICIQYKTIYSVFFSSSNSGKLMQRYESIFGTIIRSTISNGENFLKRNYEKMKFSVNLFCRKQ